MVAVVRGVEDVGVVQLARVPQPRHHPRHALVHGLQRLQPLGLQQVREAAVGGRHLVRHPEHPLLVGVGGEVVGGRVVRGHVVEERLVLRGRILGAVRGGVGHDRQEGAPGGRGLGHLRHELQRPVGDEVGQVVPGVVVSVAAPRPVHVEAVVVVGAVLDEAVPLVPARRHALPVVLVEILPEVGGGVAALLQVGGEGSLLVVLHPGRGAAVVVVGEHVVVVRVEPGQQRGAGGAAHGRGHVPVGVGGAAPAQQLAQPRHELEAAQLRVLVVSQHQEDVGSRPRREVRLPVGLVHQMLVGALAVLGLDGLDE